VTSGAAERRQELADRVESVRTRISAACERAGRAAEDVTLTVVTKTFPAADVSLLASLGVTHVGEARHPEARDKQAAVEESLVWHFVGALQTNKAAAVAGYCDVVESVDRLRLVTALDRGATTHDRVLDVLVQVNLDPVGDVGEIGTRSGVDPDGLSELADAVAASKSLRLGGLMAVAPRRADPVRAFDQLAVLHARLRADHPEAAVMSAGMSGDLEQAVQAGSTSVRVGRAVLGERPPLQ
jgi:hypothetical protein